jgi:hypothetical protein
VVRLSRSRCVSDLELAVTHHDIEAIEARMRFDEIAAKWIQRVAAFAGVAVLILLIGERL